MKNSINQFVKVLVVLFFTSFAMSCTSQHENGDMINDDQNEMMNDDQTETMDGNENMHKHGQSDEDRMIDTSFKEDER